MDLFEHDVYQKFVEMVKFLTNFEIIVKNYGEICD